MCTLHTAISIKHITTFLVPLPKRPVPSDPDVQTLFAMIPVQRYRPPSPECSVLPVYPCGRLLLSVQGCVRMETGFRGHHRPQMCNTVRSCHGPAQKSDCRVRTRGNLDIKGLGNLREVMVILTVRNQGHCAPATTCACEFRVEVVRIATCFRFDSLQRWMRDTQRCKMRMVLVYKGLQTSLTRNPSKSDCKA
jgi:hypothetical protein